MRKKVLCLPAQLVQKTAQSVLVRPEPEPAIGGGAGPFSGKIFGFSMSVLLSSGAEEGEE